MSEEAGVCGVGLWGVSSERYMVLNGVLKKPKVSLLIFRNLVAYHVAFRKMLVETIAKGGFCDRVDG